MKKPIRFEANFIYEEIEYEYSFDILDGKILKKNYFFVHKVEKRYYFLEKIKILKLELV